MRGGTDAAEPGESAHCAGHPGTLVGGIALISAQHAAIIQGTERLNNKRIVVTTHKSQGNRTAPVHDDGREKQEEEGDDDDKRSSLHGGTEPS